MDEPVGYKLGDSIGTAMGAPDEYKLGGLTRIVLSIHIKR